MCLLESTGNVINAANTTSTLPRMKGAPGPPIAKILPAASGPIIRPSPATPCERPSVSPCLVGGLANERSEEHTSELQSHLNLVCRLLLEKKKKKRAHVQQAIFHRNCCRTTKSFDSQLPCLALAT